MFLPVPGSQTALFFTVLPPHITGMHSNTQWHPGHIIMALPPQLYEWFCFSLCANWQTLEGHSKKIGQPHYIHFSESDDLIILHYFSCSAPSRYWENFYTQLERTVECVSGSVCVCSKVHSKQFRLEVTSLKPWPVDLGSTFDHLKLKWFLVEQFV